MPSGDCHSGTESQGKPGMGTRAGHVSQSTAEDRIKTGKKVVQCACVSGEKVEITQAETCIL